MYNTANGYEALHFNTTSSKNIATGAHALYENTTGHDNLVYGRLAGRSNTSGNSNLAFGAAALTTNTIGSYNVAIGDSAVAKSLGSGNVYIGNKAGANETGSNKFYLSNDTINTLIYGNFATRQILLGNANPTGYSFKGNRTLNVLGGIITDSLRVSLANNWADYVFDEDYKLSSLDEVSEYIKINKHLQGIPTTAEVTKNGVDLGDMNVKLLAKVEELTLYILQQKKQQEAQQNEIDEIKVLLKKLTKQAN
ncbi:MAG: hypothetical protein V4722_25610 [Bacteroidota bacterium]